MRRPLFTIGLFVPAVLICTFLSLTAAAAATFEIADADLKNPLVFIAYGDMRFTDPGNTSATNPAARQALVGRIAAEQPAAIFINGDITYHGVSADYEVFRRESAPWRDGHLRVYPALGNHEFSGCLEQQCLERWWTAFPPLRGRRWYSVALGSRVLALAVDSTASLLPGSDQDLWLRREIQSMAATVRVVLIVIHHPPVADVQTEKLVDHNPRRNEEALAETLGGIAAHSQARFVVSAGHIHNYERLQRAGIEYLVSGGGGAHPYEIDRTSADAYQSAEFPNYHYVRFELSGGRLTGEMIRLQDSDAAVPSHWEVKDRFAIGLSP
jgi:hypothetical protein